MRKSPVKGPPVLKCGEMAELKKEARDIIQAGAEGLNTIEVFELQLAKRYKVRQRKQPVEPPQEDTPPENT